MITPIIFFHELGHFSSRAPAASESRRSRLASARAIVSWTDRKGTRWKIAWIPLGGYVKFFGDNNAASMPDRERLEHMSANERNVAFPFKPLYQRALIVAAGPVANFILAIVDSRRLPDGVRNLCRGAPDQPRASGQRRGRSRFHAGDMIVSIDGDEFDTLR